MDNTTEQLNIPKSKSWQMFDEIAPRYDLLNHLLSFGLHISWRKQLSKYLPNKNNITVLDLATGTADVLLSLFKHNARIIKGSGVDLSENMMSIGRKKILQKKLSDKITLQRGDATKIPFADNNFDAVTISFGIRNVTDPSLALKEMYRVLNKGGRALILEFSMPENIILRIGHLFYLRTMVPLIGAIVSGHYQAYKYLNRTIEEFPYGDTFCQLMRDADFQNVKANPLLFGAATIYQGEKC